MRRATAVVARVCALLFTVTLTLAAAQAQDADPERAALTRAVRRLVSPQADADACRPMAPVGVEQRFECHVTECPGACQVVDVVTVLGLRRGRFRRVSQERVRRGDTGACGCCMAEF